MTNPTPTPSPDEKAVDDRIKRLVKEGIAEWQAEQAKARTDADAAKKSSFLGGLFS